MCRPVSAKKVPPNSGTPQGFLKGVTPSTLISLSHSLMCRTTNAAPPTMVARIQRTKKSQEEGVHVVGVALGRPEPQAQRLHIHVPQRRHSTDQVEGVRRREN